jgi:fibronectin type 3 domain-containing protein
MSTRVPAATVLLLLLGAGGGLAAEERKGEERVVAIVEADGSALVRWWLPPDPFPTRGFRLERMVEGGAASPVATVAPDPAALARLNPQLGRAVESYLSLSRGKAQDPTSREQRELARFQVELLTLGDAAAAAALGLSVRDTRPPAGATVIYTVVALGEAGQIVLGSSQPVRIAPMPPPSPPTDLRAEPAREGVLLFWAPSSIDSGKTWEAASFEVHRRESERGGPSKVSTAPVLLGVKPDLPAFRDASAPVETTLYYSVVGVDLAGRRSPESVLVKVFQPDFAALDPPTDLTARVGSGKVLLTWKAPRNANRAGWRVERAANPDAFGERLTPEPVASDSYTDESAPRGSSWYYRVSAINRRGEEGPPSLRVAVRVTDTKPPPPPSHLTAERRAGRVVLTWSPPSEAGVAAFQVERSANGREWQLLTSIASAEPRYEDLFPAETGGSVQYRVRSLTADDVASEPTAPLKVSLPDTVPPAAPVIEKIDGTGGQVKLQFRPGGGPGDADRFYVLRSASILETGSIVDPKGLSAAERSFTDTQVEAGRTLYYRIVALDAAGNRSEPSNPPAAVRVGSPGLPTPPPPRLHFESKPFPRVVAEFTAAPSPSVRWVLERREADGRWLVIQGPLVAEATSAMDVHPPRRRRAAYRLSALGTNGAAGPSSQAVELDVP